ncbi:MAG: NUDIX hydrolase [Actinobacteria bacterium]|nr:MAG: NUDIX hydrolase [Actinomycetota bacterium]
MAAGAPEVGALRRARRPRDPGDATSRARAGERRRRKPAVARAGGATARGEARRVRPDESRTVYDGTLVDVTLERWGEHEREIVEHPGAVAVVAVDREERVTLVRQLREPARKELLELPAGTLEEGEEPLATARRELEEETGQSGGEWHELAAFYTTPGFCRERMHLFLAQGVEPGEARQEADEQIELVAVPVAELRTLVRRLEDGKTIAGLLLYLDERERRG